MTISTSISKTSFNGAGSRGPFDFTFRFYDNSDIVVTKLAADGLTLTTLTETTDYTLTGAGAYAGGSVTLTVGYGNLVTDEVLTIRRILPLTQDTSIRNLGAFFPQTHEDIFDRMTMVDQQLSQEIADAKDAIDLSEANFIADITALEAAHETAVSADIAAWEANPSVSGNLAFTGTSNRITGNFSSAGASIGTKVCFQTSTANSGTQLQVIPSGTSNSAGIHFSSGSDPANASRSVVSTTLTQMFITASKEGTGSYLPINIGADGSTAIFITASGTSSASTSPKVFVFNNVDDGTGARFQVNGAISLKSDFIIIGSGKRIKADFSNATEANRTMFQTSAANEGTTVTALPSGATMGSAFVCSSEPDIDNSSRLKIASDTNFAEIKAAGKGTGAYLPLKLVTDNATAITCTASGTSTAGEVPHVLINTETDDGSGAVLQVKGSESISGNLTFTGTGARITGDFSSNTAATHADRLSFQTNVANGLTYVSTIPNGTNTASGYRFYGGSSLADVRYGQMIMSGGALVIASATTGVTAVGLPVTISTQASAGSTSVTPRLSVTSLTGNIILGITSTDGTGAERLQVTGAVYATTTIKQGVYTVATLPTNAGGVAETAGTRAFVSDANATTFASIVAAGGAYFVPVYHDGSNWRIG